MLQVLAQLVETVLAARQGTAALAGWAVMLPFALLLAQLSTGAMGAVWWPPWHVPWAGKGATRPRP